MLNDKANHASEITDLRSRIVTLESDNAALTNERDKALRVTFDVRVIEQLAAAQATNERLREALITLRSCTATEGQYGRALQHTITEALAIPNDTTALDARLAQERELCVSVAKKHSLREDDMGSIIARAIEGITT